MSEHPWGPVDRVTITRPERSRLLRIERVARAFVRERSMGHFNELCDALGTDPGPVHHPVAAAPDDQEGD